MADITMCKGNKDKLCETCYRKNAEITPEWQMFFIHPPILKNGTCAEYWEDKK